MSALSTSPPAASISRSRFPRPIIHGSVTILRGCVSAMVCLPSRSRGTIPPRKANSPIIGTLMPKPVRYAWAFPATTVGLLFTAAALFAAATIRFGDGVIEVAGGHLDRIVSLLPARTRFVAITFGPVIIGIDQAVLRRVRVHEHVHGEQYERWGVLCFPIYLVSRRVE